MARETVIEAWDYWDFIEHTEQRPVAWSMEHGDKTGALRRKPVNEKWDRGDTFEQVTEYAHYGWPTGCEQVVDVMAQLPSVGHYRKSRVTYDVYGARPEVGMYLSGEPECMVNITPSFKKPVCDIMLTGNMPFYVTSQQLSNWSVGLLSLIDSLEAQGLRCRVHQYYCIEGEANRDFQFRIELKDEQQHLDLDRIAFAIGHAAMFRRYIFGFCQTKEEYRRDFADHMGYSRESAPLDSGDIVVGKIQDYSKTAADVQKCIDYFVAMGQKLLVAELEPDLEREGS